MNTFTLQLLSFQTKEFLFASSEIPVKALSRFNYTTFAFKETIVSVGKNSKIQKLMETNFFSYNTNKLKHVTTKPGHLHEYIKVYFWLAKFKGYSEIFILANYNYVGFVKF